MVQISDIHLQVLYTPTSFFTRGIHEIYTPAIEQSDWSECTSHGTSIGYITRWRSLCDLHTEGRRPEVCKSHRERHRVI